MNGVMVTTLSNCLHVAWSIQQGSGRLLTEGYIVALLCLLLFVLLCLCHSSKGEIVIRSR